LNNLPLFSVSFSLHFNMRFLGTAALCSLLCTAFADLSPRSYDTHDFFALHLDSSTSPEHVAQVLGAHHEGQIGSLPSHHKFSLPHERSSDIDAVLEELRVRRKLRRRGGEDAARLQRREDDLDGVLWSQKLELKQRLQKRIPPPAELSAKSPLPPLREIQARQDVTAVQAQKRIASDLGIADPLFHEQWHLFNTVQLGHDMNVTGVWLEGVTGEGVVTAIIDDGLDMYSDDLKDNYFPQGSWDFNDKTPEPKPRLFDDKHGTRCAGEVAAVRNGVCGVGMAYNSKVAGIRILSKPIDDADEAAAVNYGFQQNDIYSCSWGPRDDGETMEAPGILVERAVVNGVQNGRQGKGSIFVFAAGNGAFRDDNCNFDGYTNSIYSITVGAIDREGKHPSYSEACSAQLVVAYSSGSGDAIHTTDVGVDQCSKTHGGTSAAGPLAVGAIALALSSRPELSWRDVQYLMLETAIPVHNEDDEIQVTKLGKEYSHQYGYGKIDTYALVQKARDWSLVKPQAWYHSPWLRVQQDIPQGTQGLASYFEVTKDTITQANLARLEHVTVTMNINHTRRGDLSVELRSPEGIVSHLSTARKYDGEAAGYADWTFMSVAHW
jgi:kexin